MPTLCFEHPEPARVSQRIWPVFIPFAGCPRRCVFCAQDRQTGQGTPSLKSVYENLQIDLEQACYDRRGPYELAFFGGTFTALPAPWPQRFLDLAFEFQDAGLITGVRCSTRPDCLDPELLHALKAKGLHTIELGIQSFDDHALNESGRGYDNEIAREACALVRAMGFRLGIQLMPGLPGDGAGVFERDVETAISLRPDMVRLYPCLVLEGTQLAASWRAGEYRPWTLEQAKVRLGKATLQFWQAGVPVIRLGIAPEEGFEAAVLDGPHHPAFGQSVRARALLEFFVKVLAGKGVPGKLLVPRRYSGELFGHKRELEADYQLLGLPRDSIIYEDREDFELESN